MYIARNTHSFPCFQVPSAVRPSIQWNFPCPSQLPEENDQQHRDISTFETFQKKGGGMFVSPLKCGGRLGVEEKGGNHCPPLRLARGVQSMVIRLRQETNEYAPPPSCWEMMLRIFFSFVLSFVAFFSLGIYRFYIILLYLLCIYGTRKTVSQECWVIFYEVVSYIVCKLFWWF